MKEFLRIRFMCPAKLVEHLDQQAKRFTNGNRSEYLRHLILADMRPRAPRVGQYKFGLENDIIAIPSANHGKDVLAELQRNTLFNRCKGGDKPNEFSK